MHPTALPILVTVLVMAVSGVANAMPFFFNTGNPDGLIATATRPESAGKIEIESADDFVVPAGNTLSLTSATFTGLLPLGVTLSDVTGVHVEIYRVFPEDSDVNRTSGPPTFSTPNVPTRVNSPSDVALQERDSAAGGGLTFTPGIINSSFLAKNSVLDGIKPKPNQQTGGEGGVTGQEVQFNVIFTDPFTLPADHYFFVPQVELSSGDFFWLSAPRPIVPPGTPFPPGSTDLQSWIRDTNLDPDWLRVGTDIVGTSTPFNATFTLSGDLAAEVPEPSTLLLGATGIMALGLARLRGRRQAAR